ncbi:sensor histidine kinase [Chondromyces crocatus]|uniref:sensor histidine kinase n=1 Tax=Chondromyces crocatus TaxID=52 RepID=UPI0014706E20|nr:sensor histidine kinase [Chondromyces crocatus]
MAHPTRGGKTQSSPGDSASSGTPSSGVGPVFPLEHDLAGTLHEVSNALTVILGWVERARSARGEELSRALDLVAARARDARRIVRRSIGAAGSPYDTAESPLSIVHEPLRPLRIILEDAVTSLDPEACRAETKVLVRSDAEVASLSVLHERPLLQILVNLLLNAISVSPRGGVVEITAERDDTDVIFSVIDEGPGVPPERRASLLRAGITTRAGGAGIGLRYSAALAEASGGRLTLGSSERGARFDLQWPIFTSGQTEPIPESGDAPLRTPPPASGALRPAGKVLGGARILLVEDDEAVVDLLDTALSARGARIVCVRRMSELHGALDTGPFDAVLLDLSPIEEDVPGAIAAVQRSSPEARLVVMSGTGGLVDLPDGCSAWVRKPFEVGEIVTALVT